MKYGLLLIKLNDSTRILIFDDDYLNSVENHRFINVNKVYSPYSTTDVYVSSLRGNFKEMLSHKEYINSTVFNYFKSDPAINTPEGVQSLFNCKVKLIKEMEELIK
jgi:hypothetical protein